MGEQYRRGPEAGEVLGGDGGEGEGHGVGESLEGQCLHHNSHVGRHASLLPRPVAHGELQVVPGVGKETDMLERTDTYIPPRVTVCYG